MTLEAIAARVRAGERVTRDETLELYRRAPTALLGRLADSVRARRHPDNIVTYIIDRNVNYTNVCVAKCNFCAFYRPVGSAEGYVLGFDELTARILPDCSRPWTVSPSLFARSTRRCTNFCPSAKT